MAVSEILLTSSLLLSVGEMTALPSSVRDIWIEKKNIIQAVEKNKSIFLKANNSGFSNLKLNGKPYEVIVLNKNQKQLIESKKLPLGVFFKIDNGQIYLDGMFARKKDLIKILDLTQKNNLPFILRAQLNNNLKPDYLKYIEERLRQESLSPVDIQENGIHFVNLRQNSTNETLAHFLRTLGVSIRMSTSQLSVEPTVKVEITIAEIKKEFSQKLGLKPPTGYSATVLDDLTFELEQFKLEAHALENKGLGKVLASPNILCRSGKEAEFFAGGEFPIKIINFGRQDVLWKKYGILLKVKPLADFSGQISLSLETEISSLDMSQVVDGIPGLKTNKVNSHFDLMKSKTIALSGLLKQEEGEGSEGIPFLQRLPILGYLFSSKDYRESRTELIIFVRPTIVEDPNATNPKSGDHLGAIRGI